jgi:rfaE bifunctional protein kinase chain/domain
VVHGEDNEEFRIRIILSRVLVYGHFRAVHLGHLRLFEYAQSLGDSLIVAINTENKSDADIDFSESMIKSFPLTLEVVKFKKLQELLKRVNPDTVVRGREFRIGTDQENDLIRRLGIHLMFGSGSTHLSEADLASSRVSEVSLRESFARYAMLKNFQANSLKKTLKNFSDLKVTVVGDLIVDEFVACQSLGMSQEDPLVVSTPIDTTRYLGGAGIVSAHCKALGASVNLVSLTGDDEAASWAEKNLAGHGVKTDLIRDRSRPTVVKQRFKHSNQTLFRLTHYRPEEAEASLQEEIYNLTLKLVGDCDLLIFSDFSYGTLHPTLVSKILDEVRNRNGLMTAADSQSSSQVGSLSKFKGVDLVTPTEHEARLELRNDVDGIAVLTQQLAESLNTNAVILKLGADGVLLGGYKDGNEIMSTDRIPSANRRAIDVSGAGDSLLAMSSLAMASGCKLHESAFLGSLTAGIQVSRRGNIPIGMHEVEEFIDEIFLP